MTNISFENNLKQDFLPEDGKNKIIVFAGWIAYFLSLLCKYICLKQKSLSPTFHPYYPNPSNT
jgi:hypothetical protein